MREKDEEKCGEWHVVSIVRQIKYALLLLLSSKYGLSITAIIPEKLVSINLSLDKMCL